MSASTTYVGTSGGSIIGSTAAVTLESLIGIDALTIIFGLFGGFAALTFPLTKPNPAVNIRPTVQVIQVIAAGMVASSFTEFGLMYAIQHAHVTHEAAAKAISFTLGYLAKWLLPSLAYLVISSSKTLKFLAEFWISRK
jgi:hypothetical protein